MSDIEINPKKSILDNIKAEYLQARKDKNELVVKAFSTFIGDLETKAKSGKKALEVTDDTVISAIKASLKRLEELKSMVTDAVKHAEINIEKELFQKHMPIQLSDNEIKVLIENSALKTMGEIQAFFKANYPGRYDGASVAKLAQEVLGK